MTLVNMYPYDADGTAHNLNEYMNIHSMEVINNMELETINGIFGKKFGVVTTENQLQDFMGLVFGAMKSSSGVGSGTTSLNDSERIKL